MIVTDDRHPLRSRSIHQNAANCMTIRFRYIAQPGGGVRKTYCARSRNDVQPLTSRSNAMPSKKTMESLVVVKTVQGLSKIRIVVNHKKSKLCHKVIIFISLESSCVTLQNIHRIFLFPILLSSYLDFCGKVSEIIFFKF